MMMGCYLVGDCHQVVYQQFISNLSTLVHSTLTPISCQLIDQAGVYQAVVRWSRDRAQTGTGNSSTVAVSGKMAASWSDSYNLSTSAVSVFPCEENRHLSVDFTQPACAGDHDKVRPTYCMIPPTATNVTVAWSVVCVSRMFSTPPGGINTPNFRTAPPVSSPDTPHNSSQGCCLI